MRSLRLAWHRAALEARHIGAGSEAAGTFHRASRDACHHFLFGLRIAVGRHIHLAVGDRLLEIALVVGDRAQRQRELPHGLRDGDLFGDLGRRLDRDVRIGGDDGVALVVGLLVGLLVGGEHAQIAQDRLRSLERRAIAAAGNRLGQHQVDAVAREDEAGDGALGGHGNRDGAHAGSERGGEEAAIAGLDQRALRDRLTCGNGEADDRALQLGRLGFALDVIGAFDQLLRPGDELHRRGVEDRAHRQAARGDHHFGGVLRLRGRRNGVRDRRGSTHQDVACHERRDRGDDECAYEQNDLACIHFASSLFNYMAG